MPARRRPRRARVFGERGVHVVRGAARVRAALGASVRLRDAVRRAGQLRARELHLLVRRLQLVRPRLGGRRDVVHRDVVRGPRRAALRVRHALRRSRQLRRDRVRQVVRRLRYVRGRLDRGRAPLRRTAVRRPDRRRALPVRHDARPQRQLHRGGVCELERRLQRLRRQLGDGSARVHGARVLHAQRAVLQLVRVRSVRHVRLLRAERLRQLVRRLQRLRRRLGDADLRPVHDALLLRLGARGGVLLGVRRGGGG
mmetsp:Transcript_22860/g.90653  ORF Transcript_22860/g.90653 Transcript_22860/m.90653 type:complete len:255 (+) Transcript_22860:455-1219(+)